MAFTAFVAFLRRSGWSFIYLFIFLVAWRVAFMVHWDGTSVAVTAFGLVRFYGAFRVSGAFGRGALVEYTAFVLFRKCWGWTFCGFHSS